MWQQPGVVTQISVTPATRVLFTDPDLPLQCRGTGPFQACADPRSLAGGCSSLSRKVTRKQQLQEDVARSWNLAAKCCHFIEKRGLIPAPHSGDEVNELHSRRQQLQMQRDKENQQGNTHMEEQNLWSSFLLGHYFCCQKVHTLPKRERESLQMWLQRVVVFC